MKYDLSICIPARNEEFLKQTVEDLLKNKRGKTEILVGLDGYWTDPPIADHPDVRIIHVSESIGQRAMQNKLAKLSSAKYIAKADAHCAFDEGFDVKLMDKMEDDITMVPVMRNLHIFNWKCLNCAMETYQGPYPEQCRNEECANIAQKFEKNIVWIPKTNPQSSAYRFNKNLQFKYFPELRKRLPREGLQETMSLQGSFFMCTREKYFELPLCDESWGSWGQQGSEVALKTWLSGGRVMCNFDTWYAHLFRTQHGFSFPYPQSGQSQERARKISRDLFLNDKWDKAVHPLSWLLEKFWDSLKEVGDKEAIWTKPDIDKLKGKPTKGILYFTDNELPLKIAKNVQGRIRKIAQDKGFELVSSSRKPMSNMGNNIVTKEPRGYLCMFKQILKGLEALNTDIIFMAEHDVLYPPEHFDFTPTEHKFYYDTNWYKIHKDGLVVSWKADQVSGLCAFRDDLIKYYQWRIETFDKENFDRKFEPFSGDNSEQWEAPVCHIDIRTGRNLTYNKRELRHFRKKDTAVDFRQLSIDEIPNWTLKLEDIYNS
jgi:hypothetical protein